MKLLVTGATGFIGYHVSKYLIDAGNEVTLVDNLSRSTRDDLLKLLRKGHVDFQELDLTRSENWNKLEGSYDAIFHLAAINGTKNFYLRPYEVLETNVRLVGAMLEWHEKQDSDTHIIWTSSSEVYAGVKGLTLPTEETLEVGINNVLNPRNAYAVSKIYGESAIINYSRNKRVKFSIIRPHNIFGPRMGYDHVIPEFAIRIFRKENPFKIFGGQQTRSFCFITDFVDGLIAILNSEASFGQILNLGDDRNEITASDLAHMMFAFANVTPEIQFLEAPQGSVHRRIPNLERARQLLQYEPEANFSSSLKGTLDWYQLDYENTKAIDKPHNDK